MSPSGPRDPRREPSELDLDDEKEVPTDIISRQGIGFTPKPRLRLEVPRPYGDEPECEKTDVATPISKRDVIAGVALPRDVRAWLEVQSTPRPPTGGSSLEVTMIRTVLGRGNEADIRFEDRKLSRKHASIVFTGREFRIRDEGSANGTLLNGSRVVEYVLRDGDEVVIGKTTLVFRASAA
jgi:hypothetical protein